MEKNREKTKVSKNLEFNVEHLKKAMGVGLSFDIIYRPLEIAGRDAALFFVDGLVKDDVMAMIMRNLSALERENVVPDTLEKVFQKYINYVEVEKVDNLEETVDKVLCGPIALMLDGIDRVILIDARTYPARNPEEPDIEKVVRGSRDGFTETIVFNTALIRRRIRDPKLRTVMMQIGKRSKTDVCLVYIEDIANPELVKSIGKRLQDIDIDGIPMAEKSVEEYLTTNNWNPFPQVRYTERPDVAAVQLLEGNILVIVDTSPSVIVTPTTFFSLLHHAEEYRQNAAVGLWLRWVRFAAIFISVFIMPLYLLITLEPSLLPASLKFLGPSRIGKTPMLIQFLIAELGLDMIRVSAIHTPTPLATALGLIATFLIGDIAVSIGLFAPETVLYLSAAAIGTFATPSFEMGWANRLVRLFLIIMVGLFKLPGLIIGLLLVLFVMASTKPFGVPYLWPLIPFNGRALASVLMRKTVQQNNKRPIYTRPQDYSRQTIPAPARKRENNDRNK